jgi:hypothetical protein
MSRLTGDRILNLTVYAVMLLIAAIFVVGAFQYTGRQRLVPWVIGVPTIVILIFIIIAELSPRLTFLTGAKGEAPDDAPKTDGTQVDAGSWQRVLIVYGWLLFFLVSVFILGFYISIPCFLFLFLRYESKVSPAVATVSTIAVLIPLWLIFRTLLDIPLWPGAIPMIMPGIFGGGSIPPLF